MYKNEREKESGGGIALIGFSFLIYFFLLFTHENAHNICELARRLRVVSIELFTPQKLLFFRSL